MSAIRRLHVLALLCALALSALLVPAVGRTDALDEYLQATLLNVDARQISGELKLTPGIEVWPQVMAVIDANRDGRLDGVEMQAYARTVLRDLSLQVDGAQVPLEIRLVEFAPIESFQEGFGEIRLAFGAALPTSDIHTLVFDNHHRIAPPAYLANVLTPADPALSISRQLRSEDQSRFEVHFEHRNGSRSNVWLLATVGATGLLVAVAWRARRRTLTGA